MSAILAPVLTLIAVAPFALAALPWSSSWTAAFVPFCRVICGPGWSFVADREKERGAVAGASRQWPPPRSRPLPARARVPSRSYCRSWRFIASPSASSSGCCSSVRPRVSRHQHHANRKTVSRHASTIHPRLTSTTSERIMAPSRHSRGAGSGRVGGIAAPAHERADAAPLRRSHVRTRCNQSPRSAYSPRA